MPLFLSNNFLSPNDPLPFSVLHKHSFSPFLFICDHAGIAIPKNLQELGLDQHDRYRHIAWDIGIKGVGEKLANLLNATLVMQNYSRLVIDCNRSVYNPTLIPCVSDHVHIVGNQFISDEEKKRRVEAIYKPYHDYIEATINGRLLNKKQVVLISLHSFTPEMDDFKRPWHVGILHNRYPEFALAFKKWLENQYDYMIGDNEPYALTEKNDYSVPFHAFDKKLPYLELEIRQDLIKTELQQTEWAERLALLLPLTLKEYENHDINNRKGKNCSSPRMANSTF